MPQAAIPAAIMAGGQIASGLIGKAGQPSQTPLRPTVPQFTGPATNLLGQIFGFGSPSGTGGAASTPFTGSMGGGTVQQNLLSRFGFGAPQQGGLTQVTSMLQQIGGTNPGMGTVNALEPIFQRNLAQANAQGPTFSSGRDILASRALQDFNLMGQQALQTGTNQQISALMGAGNLGLGQGQQQLEAQGQQLGILGPLLQQFFGGAFPQGTAVGPSQFGTGMQLAGGFGALLQGLQGMMGQSGGGAGFGQTPANTLGTNDTVLQGINQ